jgi:aminoglycoside phosphotransferase family enzyme/predicted kinase
MVEGDQSAAIAFLEDPASHQGQAVERISTHGAHVFLVGDRAYKIKRAVDLGFFDFSTLAKRERFLGLELELNRRTAPELYLGLRRIACRPDGRLAWDGPGAIVEWVLEMRRFDQASLFDGMVREGRLTQRHVDLVADAIARLHRGAEIRRDFGGADTYARTVVDVAEGRFASLPTLDPAACADLVGAARREIDARRALIEARREAGRVRRGHGDLHLRNLCLFEGRPTLFDCLEFDERFTITDVLYDLAFLIMDLLHRRRADFAARALARYLAWTEDHAGLAILPLFLSLRAMIRAHVTATMGEVDEARVFLADARRYLRPGPPRLVAIGGFSGTGKSTLAAALAPFVGPAPGAIVLRSDVVRKLRAGVGPEDRLAPEAYGVEITRRVYETLRTQAAVCLAAGHGVILDAVAARPEERRAFEVVAKKAGVPFDGVWLDGAPDALAQRIEARRDDASDATVAVLRSQAARDPGPIAWRRFEAARPTDELRDAVLAAFGPATD